MKFFKDNTKEFIIGCFMIVAALIGAISLVVNNQKNEAISSQYIKLDEISVVKSSASNNQTNSKLEMKPHEIHEYIKINDSNELTVDHFIERIIGKSIEWDVYVSSVYKANDDSIALAFTEKINGFDLKFAYFKNEIEQKIINLKKNDEIILTGKISKRTDKHRIIVDGENFFILK